jgi:hypothetical protein
MNEPINPGVADLGSFAWSGTISNEQGKQLYPLLGVKPEWEMIIHDDAGNPAGRFVFSEFGLRRLTMGLKVYANWYKLNEYSQWDYVGRYPVQMVVKNDVS